MGRKSKIIDIIDQETNQKINKEINQKLDQKLDQKAIERQQKIKSAIESEIEWREKEVTRLFKEAKKSRKNKRLTENLIVDLEVLARIGLSEKAMAESIGVAPITLERWRKKDAKFNERISKARSEGKAKLVNSIYGHGIKNWQAHAWLLERQYREEFALDKHKVELTGEAKNGGKIIFEIVHQRPPDYAIENAKRIAEEKKKKKEQED